MTCQPVTDAASIPVACQLLLQPSQAMNMDEADKIANQKAVLSRCSGDSKAQRLCANYSRPTGLPEETFIGQPAQTLMASPNAAGLLGLVQLATAGPEQRSGLPLRAAGDCRPRPAQEPSPPSLHAVGPAIQGSIAYARRLYRKYTRVAAGRAGPRKRDAEKEHSVLGPAAASPPRAARHPRTKYR